MDDCSDEELIAFLSEELPTDQLAHIEERLRTDDELRTRLANVVEQLDEGVHSIGAIWRRDRLSCPSRTQLGGFLLGTLDAEFGSFIEQHLTLVGCRYCNANLEDLRDSMNEESDAPSRRQRHFESSIGRLKD